MNMFYHPVLRHKALMNLNAAIVTIIKPLGLIVLLFQLLHSSILIHSGESASDASRRLEVPELMTIFFFVI